MEKLALTKRDRPIPFWSWNERLDTESTKEQVARMHAAGMGGFFMHARTGLQTRYMGEEWFANVQAAIDEAKRFGMRPWIYDENGWPSGFGNGWVNGLGVKYQQKYLRMEDTPSHPEQQICKSGDHYFYYEVNPLYVDNLDKKVVKEFINQVYEPYYARFGNEIEGFFTDEPEVANKGIVWSFVLEEAYKARYKDDLLSRLEELFLPKGDYKTTRIRFWKLVTDLFSESYCKQIYDWCSERGLKLTGHLLADHLMTDQVPGNGACMPHYEYFHIPGMDWLGREPQDALNMYQVASVAEQLGKPAVLTESFALCGQGVSFAELKGNYEWQMVRGINLLCQHLQGYSIRGFRKRDYPPAMYYQQPWWSEYNRWIDAVSRIGKILREGEHPVDLLVLQPMTTVWANYDRSDTAAVQKLDDRFFDVLKKLEKKHVAFHLGDETILQRHGKVRDGKLIVGQQAYSYVITDYCEEFLDSTKALLQEFREQGGKILSAEAVRENPVTDNAAITYTKRIFEGRPVHYFVNSSPEEAFAQINIRGRQMNVYTGECTAFGGAHRFEPWGSLVLFEDDTAEEAVSAPENTLSLDGLFTVADDPMNVLTLDRCDYYFDGQLQEEKGYILNICERANRLKRRVRIRMDFHAHLNTVPETLFLVTETPERFDIYINDVKIDKTVIGNFRDASFQMMDVRKYFRMGRNTITYVCDFVQSDRFYQDLEKAYSCGSERNKLTYDMEIEAIYLLGNFSLKTEGNWELLDAVAVRYAGDFILDRPVQRINLHNIEQQGFPFFCGELTLEGELYIEGENPVLRLNPKGINALRVQIGDFEKIVLTEDRLSLRGAPAGKQKIRLTLINNLRNLLGPHHLEQGECRSVRPKEFYQEESVWTAGYGPTAWDDGYCFLQTGI